jgi:predicted transcriptional regulator
MVRRSATDVTDTELAMLQVLWDRGEVTRRQIADALYPGGSESHYATVQKLLERLEKKGFVRHERRDGVLVFRAIADRDAFIRRRLQVLAEKFCGGAVAPLVMNLVRSQPLSAADVEELYAFLRELRRAKPSGDPG